MTDNHGYETPKKGATEWHESLNRNFRYIDRDVEIRDIDDAKTDYSPKSGAKFLATDTENVYVGDGSQWLRLATSGQSPLFDTVSAETIVDRNSGNGYSVDQLAGGSGSGGVEPAVDAVVTLEGGTPTAYRASGSEIAHDSDAGAVLNSAISEVASNGGGSICICSGTYLSSTKITVPSNITIRGAGRGNTVFRATSAGKGWTTASNSTRNVTIRDLTVDGDLQGGRTGINLVQAIDSLIQNVEVKNAGGTPENNDTTPSLRVTGGLRSHIVNCHVENSNSVSIEAAIGAKDCSIVNCTITRGRREGGAGFLHGYSIEKSESCAIIGCHADSSNESGFNSFRPALNFNNANRAVVANNTVRGCTGGAYNTNGPCYDNVLAGNTFANCTDTVKIGGGNAGEPHGTVIANNAFRGGTVQVGVKESIVRNNAFANAFFRLRSPTTAATVVGNHWYGNQGKDIELARIEGSNGTIMLANNHTAREETAKNNGPSVKINADYGIMVGNSWGTYGGGNPVRAPIELRDGTRWLVANNYFRSADTESYGIGMCGGKMVNNVFEGADFVDAVNGSQPLVVKDNDYLRSGDSHRLSNPDGPDYTIRGPRQGSYTGDGTQGRFIQTFTNPEHVIIEGSDGTLYDVHAQFGTGFEHTVPSGELSIADGGFTIGSGGGNTHPNSSGEQYTFYAR